MQGYTTISVKPKTKAKVRLLKGSNTYSEYLEKVVEDEWEDSDFDEEDLKDAEEEAMEE